MDEQILVLKKYSDNSFAIKCAFCEGFGIFPEHDTQPDDLVPNDPCPICRGRGINRIRGNSEFLIQCRFCNGSGRGWNEDGYFMGEICPVCKGRGVAFADSISLDYSDQLDSFWSLLHPVIVKVASSRFNAGHFADAVEAALKEVNLVVKRKVKKAIGQELDGAGLMQRALSLENPIIRMADLSTESGKDTQKGYMQIYSGAMTGIRNPKAHDNVVIDERRAIHLLFLASLLMDKLYEHEPAERTRD